MQRELELLPALLAGSGLSPARAARLALELAEGAGATHLSGPALMKRCRRVIHLGCEARRQEARSSTFAQAMQAALDVRHDRRPRTRAEFGSICRRMLRAAPELARRRVRSFSPEDCRRLLEATFASPRQRAKGRLILHGIFSHCLAQGWCSSNPVAALRAPALQESEIHPLSPGELTRLLHTAQQARHRACMPALGLMLWAGVRPAEVTRLHWEDIDFDEGIICIRPRHAKTGGSRHITLYPVLRAWLRELGEHPQGALCPPGWPRRWIALRREARLMPWRQDVLRHSFASYHAKQWHDLSRLQLEMGHRSAELLRTRYLSMRGITAAAAARFWKPRALWAGATRGTTPPSNN